MGMLKSIAIAGFKSFGAKVEVPLRSLNILIGANGSGKSNFLNVLSFLQAYSLDRIDIHVAQAGGADRILHFGSRQTKDARLTVDFFDGYHFTLILIPTVSDRLAIKLAKAHVSSGRMVEWGQLNSWKLYHFHDTGFHSPMKKTAKLHDNRFLRQDGSNLASFLYLLRERHEASYGLIRNTIRQVAPFFDDFVLEPTALNPDTIRLEWRHRVSDAQFDASSLSDGTLRFMALAALLLQPKERRPAVVLLDEPELGLHPLAITVLASMLRFASRETQIVLATQSPTLLDHFEPEDVLVAERVDGQTRLNRLEAEELQVWLEDYSLGQLWEKNELGGRPAREAPEPG